MKYQKKALRIIDGAPYNAPTEDLFKKYNIMTIDDMYQSQLGCIISPREIFPLRYRIYSKQITSYTNITQDIVMTHIHNHDVMPLLVARLFILDQNYGLICQMNLN